MADSSDDVSIPKFYNFVQASSSNHTRIHLADFLCIGPLLACITSSIRVLPPRLFFLPRYRLSSITLLRSRKSGRFVFESRSVGAVYTLILDLIRVPLLGTVLGGRSVLLIGMVRLFGDVVFFWGEILIGRYLVLLL